MPNNVQRNGHSNRVQTPEHTIDQVELLSISPVVRANSFHSLVSSTLETRLESLDTSGSRNRENRDSVSISQEALTAWVDEEVAHDYCQNESAAHLIRASIAHAVFSYRIDEMSISKAEIRLPALDLPRSLKQVSTLVFDFIPQTDGRRPSMNSLNTNGLTLLAFAVLRNALSSVVLLHTLGCDPHAVTLDGRTPLDIANQNCFDEITQYLENCRPSEVQLRISRPSQTLRSMRDSELVDDNEYWRVHELWPDSVVSATDFFNTQPGTTNFFHELDIQGSNGLVIPRFPLSRNHWVLSHSELENVLGLHVPASEYDEYRASLL